MSSLGHVLRSAKIGADGEKAFQQLFNARDSTDGEDINHIDFFTHLGKIDVKGEKYCHKKGYVLVELLNVIGRAGWASKESKADHIAFLFPDGFYIVSKDDLRLVTIDLCPKFEGEESVLRKNKVSAEAGLYQWIGRENRKDVFTYIKQSDLYKMIHLFVPKP